MWDTVIFKQGMEKGTGGRGMGHVAGWGEEKRGQGEDSPPMSMGRGSMNDVGEPPPQTRLFFMNVLHSSDY